MKSKISWFNPVVFRKNVTRFAPAWVLYTVGLFLVVITIMGDVNSTVGFARDLGNAIAPMAFLNFCYAFLCAQLLFGDLYNSRMCNALHAMPIRRESWFATNVVTGLAFSAVPNIAVTLFCMVFTGELWLSPLLWLAGTVLQYVFFFGTAVLSSYCVGHRFAMALVYAILNGFSVIVYWLVDSLYAPMLYGMQVEESVFLWFCPVLQMVAEFNYFEVYSPQWDSYNYWQEETLVLGDGWIYLGICAVLGLVYMACALILYRKRNLECAGDAVTVKWLSPVFLLLYTFCGGTVCHAFFSLFWGEENIVFLLIGLAIGFFTGKMLLERTVRVFRPKTLARFGILVLTFLLSLLLTKLDPLGITRWVPKAEQVKQIDYRTTSTNYSGCVVTDPEKIRQLCMIHQHGVENRNEGVNGKADVRVYLDYTLKNGATRSRYYYIDIDTQAGQALKMLLSSPEAVFETDDPEGFLDTVERLELAGVGVPKEQWQGLYEAMLLDCAEGTLAQDWNFYMDQKMCWLTVQRKAQEGNGLYRYTDIVIRIRCKNTAAWMRANGYSFDQ